jgi:hypothetical protein
MGLFAWAQFRRKEMTVPAGRQIRPEPPSDNADTWWMRKLYEKDTQQLRHGAI